MRQVNPWEIEADPDEAKKLQEEVIKARKASARAQRAAALARRSEVKLDDELQVRQGLLVGCSINGYRRWA